MMNTQTLVTVLGAGCLLLACGGAPSDSTGTTTGDLNAKASQHGPAGGGRGGGSSGAGGGNGSDHGDAVHVGGGGQGTGGHGGCKAPCARGGRDADGGDVEDVDGSDNDDDDAADNGAHGHGHSGGAMGRD